MLDFIEAPTPFLVGVLDLPEDLMDVEEVFYLDILNDRFSTYDMGKGARVVSREHKKHFWNSSSDAIVPEIPEQDVLRKKVERLIHSYERGREKNSTVVQNQLIQEVSECFEHHLDKLFASMPQFLITDTTDSVPVCVFMKDAFLAAGIDVQYEEWFNTVLETQQFEQYSEGKLEQHVNDLKSVKKVVGKWTPE
eukprot:TRINITY_DN3898_c0_g1_i2.p1 TRINITY_DN3898_c0_g1~~TRINITY_DN3898_c0_g1_i2.p1  ORF type:complete len:194 (-),score=58.71 TRINITY_DN3898_c0_g1_i2:174-755(-)